MNHNQSQSGGDTSHMWLMLLCCLIPFGLILAVSIFGLSLGPLTSFLPYALVLLCPLLMFFMMRGMGHEHDTAHGHHAETVGRTDTALITKPSSPAIPVSATPTANASSNQERCH